MSTPDQIEEQIIRTRTQLSADVDRLGAKVSPSKVVSRRVESIKSGASSVRDRVMGSSGQGGGLHGMGQSVGSTISNVSDAAGSAPQTVRRQAQGNPLAAGLIAFGVGWLLASLAPAAQPEIELAAAAEEKAKELATPLKETAQDAMQNLKEPAQQAVEQVKSTATDAAQETADQARASAQDVKAPLQQQ